MTAPPGFGRRGLNFGPASNPPPPPPRRFRSDYVWLTAVGLIALGAVAEAGHRSYQCRERAPDDPDRRPDWCDSSHYSHSSGGHGFYSGGGGSSGESVGHAGFGGFGHAGAGHGGGT